MILPALYFVSLIHSLVARAVIRKMLEKHIAEEDVNNKKLDTNTSSDSVFIASYPQGDRADVNEMDDRKIKDLEASTDHIAPIATLDVSRISPLCSDP